MIDIDEKNVIEVGNNVFSADTHHRGNWIIGGARSYWINKENSAPGPVAFRQKLNEASCECREVLGKAFFKIRIFYISA